MSRDVAVVKRRTSLTRPCDYVALDVTTCLRCSCFYDCLLYELFCVVTVCITQTVMCWWTTVVILIWDVYESWGVVVACPACPVGSLDKSVVYVVLIYFADVYCWVKFSKETDFTKILQNRSPFCPKTSKTVSWLLWGARKKIRRPRAATRTPGYVHLLV